MREKLLDILRKLGLYNAVRTCYCFFKKIIAGLTSGRKIKKFNQDFDNFPDRLKKLCTDKERVVFVGILCAPRKPTLIEFLSNVKRLVPDKEFLLFDEYIGEVGENPFVRIIPPRSVPNNYDKFLEIRDISEYEQLISEKEFLNDAVINLSGRLDSITPSYAKALVCRTYRMYTEMLDILKPETVVIWNEYSALHTVCKEVCKEKGIRTAFLEFGVIPGTFALEYGGQMGRSIPAVNWQEFHAQPVDEEELSKAGEILDYLKESRLNRNVQPENDESFRERLKKGRPIVLFAGQQDFDSGMVPYTDETKKFNSPCFETTLDAAYYLAGLAEKNDWNFIFKPHPNMDGRYRSKVMPDNLIYVSKYDLNELIDMSDVVVTILSQVAYVSLIRGTPAVMLGYNQLRGKECTYEAFEKEHIEKELLAALEKGYTDGQKENFRLHTAQLLKYYLFDNLSDRPLRYGRTLDDQSDM